MSLRIPDNCTSAHSRLSCIAAYQVRLIDECNLNKGNPDRMSIFFNQFHSLVTMNNEAIGAVVKINYHAADPAIHIKDNKVTIPPSANDEAQFLDFAHCLLSKTEPNSEDWLTASVLIDQKNKHAADIDYWDVRHGS
jgi:hypothetical protein